MIVDNRTLGNVRVGEELILRAELMDGDQSMLHIMTENVDAQSDGAELQLLVDAAQVQQLGLIMPLLEQTLISIEREFRNIEPMFTLTIEDVQARSGARSCRAVCAGLGRGQSLGGCLKLLRCGGGCGPVVVVGVSSGGGDGGIAARA